MSTKSEGLPELDRPIPGREITNPTTLTIEADRLQEIIDFAWLTHAQETTIKTPGGCMTYKHNILGQTMAKPAFRLAVLQVLDEVIDGLQVEVDVPENE